MEELTVNLPAGYYGNLVSRAKIADWLKIEYPMIYQLGELTVHNQREERQNGLSQAKP